MYINHLSLSNFRTFKNTSVHFLHRDADFARLGLPRPKCPNVNLLLGNNGFGKTTLLKAVAIAALGPAVQDARLPIYHLIRQGGKRAATEARIEGDFTSHEQDGRGSMGVPPIIESRSSVTRIGDIERLRWTHPDEKAWHPIFSEESDAFFFVGYGASRRVETPENVDFGARRTSSTVRALRIRSLFEESYSLIPLSMWLPDFEKRNRGRFVQVKNLINRLLDGTPYRFSGARDKRGEYLFERDGQTTPFRAMSDGFRAYLGWIGDLLYHVCHTCPAGKKLVDNCGIVMVDEIDLHLHPKWQMTVVPTLAQALPNLQFIVTTHSPLIVGSLEWANIVVVHSAADDASVAERIPQPVHGLDADQVLLTGFFGMESTRTAGRSQQLKNLTLRARDGDIRAAADLLKQMSQGAEA